MSKLTPNQRAQIQHTLYNILLVDHDIKHHESRSDYDYDDDDDNDDDETQFKTALAQLRIPRSSSQDIHNPLFSQAINNLYPNGLDPIKHSDLQVIRWVNPNNPNQVQFGELINDFDERERDDDYDYYVIGGDDADDDYYDDEDDYDEDDYDEDEYDDYDDDDDYYDDYDDYDEDEDDDYDDEDDDYDDEYLPYLPHPLNMNPLQQKIPAIPTNTT